MATHPSALKRARQNLKRRLRNKMYKTRVKNSIKALDTLLAQGEIEKAKEIFNETVSIIQKAAGKGVIHKNKASRKVSSIAQKLNKALEARVNQ